MRATDYSESDFSDEPRDSIYIINEGDTIGGLYVKGTMPFSSFTGLPYDRITKDKVRVVICGISPNVVQGGYGPVSIRVRKVFSGLVLGKVEE